MRDFTLYCAQVWVNQPLSELDLQSVEKAAAGFYKIAVVAEKVGP